ncbi:hypothetical protein MRX96_043404 [Rhipicephalus microplus]
MRRRKKSGLVGLFAAGLWHHHCSSAPFHPICPVSGGRAPSNHLTLDTWPFAKKKLTIPATPVFSNDNNNVRPFQFDRTYASRKTVHWFGFSPELRRSVAHSPFLSFPFSGALASLRCSGVGPSSRSHFRGTTTRNMRAPISRGASPACVRESVSVDGTRRAR